MVGQKPEPKTRSIQSTTKITIGSTGIPIIDETTATISGFPQETTATTSKQAADSGSSTVLIISIVIGVIAL
jgi:hypothetical protein